MSIPDDSVLHGMEELLLSLVRKHSTPHQWGSWLKIILQAAAMEGDEEAVLVLLKAGAYPSGAHVKDDRTPLHAAAQGGSLAVVAALLKSRAIRDVNKKTQATGETPLHLAVKHGHADVALALVRAGADANLADVHRWSPLIHAASQGRAELVNDLLLSGSRVDARGMHGDTALGIAVRLRHLGVIKVLLQARACPGARGQGDMSPVDLAVEGWDIAVLLELLASGPNLGMLDDKGDSALHLAVKNGVPEAINVLVDAGADLSSDHGAKTTYLHIACFYLHRGSVEVLLRRNSMEHLRDEDNNLPYDVVGLGIPEEARDNGVVEEIRKLLTRAPADRIWRRRGWLVMLNARKRGTDEKHRRKDDEDKAKNNGNDEAEHPSVLSSRRKLADGGKWVTDDGAHMHPSRKRLHWIVTKMVDAADELIFRSVVSYL